jgi:AraC-like DNA-binding protein
VLSRSPADKSTEKRAKTVIFGLPLTRQNLHLPEDYIAVSVRFHPGGLYKFLGIPMPEFLNKNIDAALVLGNEISEVNDRMANAKSYHDMISIMEAYLLEQMQKVKRSYHPVDTIGQLILQNPQSFSLDKFASKACLSASQMERRFIQQVGIPPKLFARVCRFYQAFVMKEKAPFLSCRDIALDAGYTDYQHLVRDFKQFSDSTPKVLFEEESTSPEKQLGLNPGFAIH